MRSYEAARGYFNVMEKCGRGAMLLIGIGFVLLLFSLGEQGLNNLGPIGMLTIVAPLLFLIGLCGLFLGYVQTSRAGVDTAEYTQQVLDVARKQLEISRQALEQNRKIELSYAALANTRPAPEATQDGGQTNAAAEDSPSYANREAAAPVAPADVASPASIQDDVQTSLIAENPSPSAPAIEHKPSIPLPDVSHLVTYKDGRYTVEGKPFWSRKEAEEHARNLVSA